MDAGGVLETVVPMSSSWISAASIMVDWLVLTGLQ